MSGGHFDYIQYRIDDAANEIERQIEWEPNELRADVQARFRIAADTLRRAAKMLQRVDWLICCDDGEDSFMRRWDEELGGPT
ncbi:MAG: hypothetical protein EBU31_00445 [Proteobacteria bacterium]|nr:hypothetical protein [Pseudomonadota bacterium]